MIARAFAALTLLLAPGWAQNADPYPSPPSIKGLQVQMVDDALALGIHHAGINVDLGGLVDIEGNDAGIPFEHGGRTWRFRRGYVEALDRQIAPLSERGIVVSVILLAIAKGESAADRMLLHPAYDPAAPNRMGAWNCESDEGLAWYRAALGFLAARWSTDREGRPRVWNWIVGNEVNSHWWWFNRGRATMREVADSYERAVRVTHEAVRSASQNARVFVSLEHHWNVRFGAGDERQAFPGRAFLEVFAALARARGEFDWHVAFHPYPENLFECRFWNDRTASDDDEAARITFRNLPVLTRFLDRPGMRFREERRRIILSEQGFHCADGEHGERDQAAAFAAAWTLVERTDGIDAFLLHRHVDHAHEGGLRLGLWSRAEDSVCTPERQRWMYRVFAAAGTEAFAAEAAFALPVIGIESWAELPTHLSAR